MDKLDRKKICAVPLKSSNNMGTEKSIFGKGLEYSMRDEGKPKYDLPKGKDAPSLDCKDSLDGKCQAEFDRYVRKIYETEEALHRVDPYEKKPLKALTDKVNRFLQRHAGLNYEEFVRRVNPCDFNENDYSLMPKKALKRRLFDHRAYLYLCALDDCEREGANIELLLQRISEERIPFLKKEQNEPTFNAILVACRKD